jgi:tetratricopeptide (TPR) repeat protein
MLRVLQTSVSFVETPAYVGVPAHVHRHRARGQVALGKFDEALKEVQAAEAVQPGNIQLVIDVVPELEKAGRKKEAADLYGRVLALWEKVIADYPKSASSRNTLAWMAVCCRRDLDKALEHATKAVELAPDSAAYTDTLAEVHFQRGDKDKAIELMKRCMALEPKRAFYQRQMKRFEAGDASAPLPPSGEEE